ncbi:MAG: 6-hydroxymethylpterin diphosphokinase MptE-like protein [Campylobacterota bacterium]|nr:6-hydroxymethylpterin diphosphokinase MptE-like protein [Campylobacterota bacterium]
MQDIEKIAIETYQKNLNYFQKSQKSLLQQLLEFNTRLENGTQIALYDLEYLDGYFDIRELKSGNFLYSGDSNEISQQFCDRVNYKKNSFTFEGFPIFDYSKEKQENLIDEERGAEGLFPIMNYYLKHTDRDDTMRYIAKYMFIGVGLGGHISLISKKIQADDYLIVEDDFELFRLSLFTTKYYEIAKKARLYFAVDSDKKRFATLFGDFLSISLQENRYLKYTHFPVHSKEKIKNIQNELAIQSFVTFPYKTILTKYIRPLEYLNEANIINLSKHLDTTLFKDKPILIVAAGPSLQKNIEFIKNSHQKFVVIAISAVLKTLYKENIKPDIVFHIDGFSSSLPHFEDIDAKLFLKDSIAILSSISPLSLQKRFTKENIFYYQLDTDYIQGFDAISTPCVGSLTTIFSLLFNPSEIYIVGLDLAFDAQTGATHSAEHFYNKNIDISNRKNISQDMGLRKNIFKVKGNFQKNIYTNSLFYSSISSLHLFIPLFKRDNQTIYNLSDGAFIEDTTPLFISNIEDSRYKDLDKSILHSEIKQLFLDNSVYRLTQEQMQSISNRLKNSQKLKLLISKYQTKTKVIDSSKHMQIFYSFIADILMMNSKDSKNLTMVCDYFFRYALPLLSDLLNNRDIKDRKNHIKRVNNLIIKELFEIEEIYSSALKRFMKRDTKE